MLEMIQLSRAPVNLGVDDPNADEDVIVINALEVLVDSEERIKACSAKAGYQDDGCF